MLTNTIKQNKKFLALRYCDRLLPFILQKFEQNNEKMRIASLNIIKHLINSSEEQMSNKKQLVISGLRPLLSETNNKVTKISRIYFLIIISCLININRLRNI